jgi:hypothetical protein
MAATTTPLPTPPFVDVPGLPNFRDCGGYPVTTSSGDSGNNGDSKPQKMIRRGILFRSSEPSLLTDDGIAILRHTLRISHVFDLRSLPEIERDAKLDGRQPREWHGSQRVFAPVFLDEDYSPEAVARRYAHFSSAEDGVSWQRVPSPSLSRRALYLSLSPTSSCRLSTCSIARDGVSRGYAHSNTSVSILSAHIAPTFLALSHLILVSYTSKPLSCVTPHSRAPS